MKTLTYATNRLTGLYFVSGKGFIARTAATASALSPSELATVRACFENVVETREPVYNDYVVTLNKGATVKISARSHSHARSTIKALFGLRVTSVTLA